MELKYLLVLTVVGLSSAFSISRPEEISDFPEPSSEIGRAKRGLHFKKYENSGGGSYSSSSSSASVVPRDYREVHYYNDYARPQYVEGDYFVARRPQQYHRYEGQYSGGYLSHGGSSHYLGGPGGYYTDSRPTVIYQAPAQSPPVLSSGAHNQIDRGQGAAAVNNIAIIRARAGSSSSSSSSSSAAAEERTQ